MMEEFTDDHSYAMLFRLPREKAEQFYGRNYDEKIPFPYSSMSNVFTCPDFFIPMQTTEAYDGLGKEIFEGDILRVCNGDSKNWVVRWGVKGWIFPDETKSCLEVIGNIYENPELV